MNAKRWNRTLGLVLLASMVLGACGGAPAKTKEAEPATPEEICASTPCRPGGEARLMVDEERYFGFELAASPYIYDGVVNIAPGETVYFEASRQPDGKLTDLKYVNQPTNPQKTFEVSFSQHVQGRTHKWMMLAVKSPFDGIVRYRAAIRYVGSEDFAGTSTCPLHQGVPGMEMWPDLIMQVLLTDFRIVSPESEEASRCD